MGTHYCTEDDLAKFNKEVDQNISSTFSQNLEKYICLDEPEKIDLYGSPIMKDSNSKVLSLLLHHRCVDKNNHDCKEDSADFRSLTKDF